MKWVEDNIKMYYDWLREKTAIQPDVLSGWTTITTPFTGMFNDPIEIFAKLTDGKMILSDDGQTLYNLDLAGVNITRSAKRKEHFDAILLNYGVVNENNELQVSGFEKDFNQKKLNLLSAIIEISDMAMLSSTNVSSLFREDVKKFLDEQGIIYTPQFIAKGTTGIEFAFDFQIAGREKEIVIKSFNSLNKINVPNFLFSWNDVKPFRERISGKQLKGLAIVNNVDKDLRQEYINALKSKAADVILWDERHLPESREKLVA
ncbi:MAG: DUF1828 domain-containing protein [Lentisphaeria bacterium]|jgi:hypothetical protein